MIEGNEDVGGVGGVVLDGLSLRRRGLMINGCTLFGRWRITYILVFGLFFELAQLHGLAAWFSLTFLF